MGGKERRNKEGRDWWMEMRLPRGNSEIRIRKERVFGLRGILQRVESSQTRGRNHIINPGVRGEKRNNQSSLYDSAICPSILIWPPWSADLLWSPFYIIILLCCHRCFAVSVYLLSCGLPANQLSLCLQSLESTRRMLALVEEVSPTVQRHTLYITSHSQKGIRTPTITQTVS